MDMPFSGSEAVANGALTVHQLEHDFARIHRDIYIAKGVELTAEVRAFAAALFAGPDAVLTGLSAAAVHGTRWIPDGQPAELVRSGHFRAPTGITSRDYRLLPDEVETIAGVRVASAARTAFDIGRMYSRHRAVPLLDALCNATELKPNDVAMLADRHRGARGIVRLRSMLLDVDGGAESPPESHTRLELLDAGQPRPETQIEIADSNGYIFARADLGWRRWRVLVEYDGEHHWTDRGQRAWDIERTAALERLGWKVIRVSAELLYDRPHVLVARVRAALRASGYDERVVTRPSPERRA